MQSPYWVAAEWKISVFTHTPCGSMGLQTDFLSFSYFSFFSFFPPPIFFILGTESAMGGYGSLTVYAILFKLFRGLLPENDIGGEKLYFWNFIYIFKPFFGFSTLLFPYAVHSGSLKTGHISCSVPNRTVYNMGRYSLNSKQAETTAGQKALIGYHGISITFILERKKTIIQNVF